MSEIILGDCLDELKKLDSDSIDLVCTDPPYGYSFMGKDWDKAVPSVEVWQECLRVLKPGAFCMVMSAPRSDVQMHMISNLEQAGFRIDFTPIYWTYASGFPKAGNIGKLVDKRLPTKRLQEQISSELKIARAKTDLTMDDVCEALGLNDIGHGGMVNHWENKRQIPTPDQWDKLCELLPIQKKHTEFFEKYRYGLEREIIGKGQNPISWFYDEYNITASASDEAKALDGSYAGFQPKPAVEVIIVAMKPLSEKTFVDQALKNGKGITWLDDCRIPVEQADRAKNLIRKNPSISKEGSFPMGNITREQHANGRFPANLLVSDDVLNDHSRYFDLDKWANTLPFLIVPKASKREKNRGLEQFDKQEPNYTKTYRPTATASGDKGQDTPYAGTNRGGQMKNGHPTVKPLKLMSYLITLGSREGDTVLDPFCGSGTTCIAAKKLKRNYIGIEREPEYVEITKARLNADKQESLL